MECPTHYIYGPFSNTCLRYHSNLKTYAEAKHSCESAGGYMATFETLDSQFWLRVMRNTGNPHLTASQILQ